MEEFQYIIKNQDSFDLRDIFECGQCFRWEREEDNSYTGIVDGNIINVKKIEIKKEDKYNEIIFSGLKKKDINIEDLVKNYFDLDRDYEEIKEKLRNVDDNMKCAISYCPGIRILNQDLWEMILSYIISANNNIPRIKKIINSISKKYGKEIEYKGKEYYSFPSIEELENATISDFRNCGAGFRDKYLFNTINMINNKEIDLDKLYELNTSDCKKELLKLDGVGPKVCDCILLFSDLKRFDVFPVDVWVRRVVNELYLKRKDEKKINNKDIEKVAIEKFGDLRGIAQQYLFMWKRENK